MEPHPGVFVSNASDRRLGARPGGARDRHVHELVRDGGRGRHDEVHGCRRTDHLDAEHREVAIILEGSVRMQSPEGRP